MDLNAAALEIILKMRPYPDGSQLYPRFTPGEPMKRYIHRITRQRNGSLLISGTIGSRTYYGYSQREAETRYNHEARTA